ncbi:E3 ubiquitin-protein ligase TRIM69-like [Rhinoraja longicauda]
MASKHQIQSLTEDAICPICLDFFSDPVILECGHNFCRSCITQSWDKEGRNSCPECREVSADRTLRVNRALASIAEKAQALSLNTGGKESKLHCEEHQEELKLFCETDKKLVCVICVDAREHRQHRFMSIQEAVESYQEQIKTSLEILTKNKSAMEEMEQQQKEKISGVREQSQNLLTYITSVFAELRQILNEKERLFLKDLREDEESVLNPMEKNLRAIQEEINSIQEKLLKLQERMNQTDSLIFLKEETRQKRRISDDNKSLSVADGALDFGKFDDPFLLNTVLRKTTDYVKRVSVTLDVETAHAQLEVSEDRKRVRRTGTRRRLPDTGKRFTYWGCVLGSEGFTSGRHYWEVEVSFDCCLVKDHINVIYSHVYTISEPVSVPVLGYLSPANVSRLGGSVSVSCASARGSLPIQYKWYEINQLADSEISNSNQLDLSCEILRSQHRRFYCKASNNRGTESSEILIVKVFNGAGTCSYVTEINNTVSGALWAESEVRGVVGRAITIDCHYAAVYRSHTKYWCRGTNRQCAHVVETNGKYGQGGRVSITDNPARGIFTVAVEDLHSGDTGWYSCGITAPGEPTFKVYLQVSEEPVSVPVLGFLPPANVSCLGGSVPMSCESVRGSLPISYSWYEIIPAVDSNISDSNTLDLHCQFFKHQHHQYYCNSSNQRGSKSSEMVNVSISSNGVSCSFLVKINGTGLEYSCETLKRSNYSSSYIAWTVGRWLLFLLLLIWSISIAFFTRASKRRDKSEPGHSAHELQ